MISKSKPIVVAFALSVAMGLALPGPADANHKRAHNTAKGAVIGGGVGYIVGGSKGAVGGAVVGAIAGNRK
jgi:hypothetical protein